MRKADRFLKRAMSVIVTSAMVLSIMPATIYAEGETAEAETAEVEAVNEVVAEAEDDLKYVTMNVPYRDFYEALGVTVDNKDYCYDTVTTATTRFFYSGSGTSKGTYSYVERDAEGTVTGGNILGVTYPVAMTAEDYDELSNISKAAGENYYFTDYEGTPDSYMTVAYEDKKYVFSTDTIKENSADGLDVINFTTEADYGDYQIELEGLYPQKTEGDTVIPGVVIGDKSGLSISGVILTTDDGKKYGMGMLENTWVGTRREWVEIAWSVPEGNGLTNHGGAKFKTFDTNGKTLKEVKVITDQGSYTIGCDQKLSEFYSGAEQVEAEIVDPKTLQISVPGAFEDPRVTVSYKSGRSVVTVAEDAAITAGKVALEGLPEAETAYSVKLTSNNYAPKIVTVTYGAPSSDGEKMITDAQKAQLNEYIVQGSILVKANPNTTALLKEHVEEARELLEKENATSEEAEELIGELEELISEVQGAQPVMKYVTMNIPYRDFYETLGVEVDNKDYCYDTVSTATTRFFYSGSGTSKGTYSYVERDAAGTVTGGDILGVTYPVAMAQTDYNVLSQLSKETGEDYYFTDYKGTPDSYMTMAYNDADGSYGFSVATVKENEVPADGLEVINFTTEADYGDYQIELKGLYPQKKEGDTVIPGVVIGDKSGLSISGVILTTDDGKKYGMGMLENTWVGTRREWVEIAWSVPEGNGLTNHGGAKFKTFDTNGKTLKEVKVITDQGSYTIPCDVALTEFYSGTEQVKAEIVDPQTLEISVPSAFEEPKVTVSYKSGRSVVAVAEDEVITNGKIGLDETKVPETETAYSVKVTSKNYAPKIMTVTYGTPVEDTGITAAQKEKLNGYIATGTKWVEYDPSLTLLEAHIQEAKDLLADENATSAEAEELIGELEELIEEAQQKHPDVTMSGDSTTPTPPATTTSIKKASTITLKNKTATYTGKAIAIGKATVTGSKGTVTYKYYSDKKCTKAVAASKVKNAGTYYVKATVAADSNYNSATSGVATLQIKKAAQTIKGATASKTIKSKKLKKAAQSFSIGAKATKGTVTYSKTSGNKKIKVSTKGKVKVAKGLKKGTYKIKVKIKAKATTNYAAKTQTKTIKITVK